MLRVIVNPAFASLTEEIRAVAVCDCRDCTPIFSGRNTIYRTEIGGIDLCVKAFHVPSPFNRVIYSTLRHGKARRSYDNALALLATGIDTAEPIAYVEERRRGLLRRSYYFCRYLEAEDIRLWQERFPDKDELLEALAHFTLKIHKKGIFFKDFSPGNILFTKTDGKYHFSLIDINRMQFGVTSRRKLYRNFRCINIESPEETALFAEAYARVAGVSEEKMRAVALKMLQGYYREKARHRAIKRLLSKLIGIKRRTLA